MTPSAAVASTNWPLPDTLSRYMSAASIPMAAEVVSHPHGRAGGPSAELLREARAVNEPAGGLRRRVEVARLVLGRSPLALLSHPAIDEPRVDLLQLPIAYSPRVELPRRVVLDQDVEVDHELLQELAPLFLLEIERDGL